MKKEKQIKFNPEVHYSIHGRKVFKAKMWLITLGLVLVLLGCAAMFTFGTVTWDPDQGFAPKPSIQYWWQLLLVICGGVLTVGSLVAYFLICYHIFKGFYATQAIYWKTPEFKKAKAKALKVDLYKLKKADLKWYKKLGYINTEQKRQALEEQKKWVATCKANKEKVNYANPKA